MAQFLGIHFLVNLVGICAVVYTACSFPMQFCKPHRVDRTLIRSLEWGYSMFETASKSNARK